MLHARVMRPPAIGATLVSVDESSIARCRASGSSGSKASWRWSRTTSGQPSGRERAEGDVDRVASLPGHDKLEPYLRQGVVERDQTFVDRGDVSRPRSAPPQRR